MLFVNESLFKKEEEEVGIASDVVKVVGEDPATLGSLRRDKARWRVGYPFRCCVLLGLPVRNPRDRNNSPILRLLFSQLRNISDFTLREFLKPEPSFETQRWKPIGRRRIKKAIDVKIRCLKDLRKAWHKSLKHRVIYCDWDRFGCM